MNKTKTVWAIGKIVKGEVVLLNYIDPTRYAKKKEGKKNG